MLTSFVRKNRLLIEDEGPPEVDDAKHDAAYSALLSNDDGVTEIEGFSLPPIRPFICPELLWVYC